MITKIWYENNVLQYLLFPLSLIYRTLISIRRFLYKKNIFKTHKFNIPLIIVGNITVGGTGKTPLVIALVKALQKNGFHPGVISRGYGGKSKIWPVFVDKNSDPVLVGDEAILIAKNTGVPVVVGPKRVESVVLLTKQRDARINVIVSDDGLQHYALDRTIEIAVIDSTRGFGNGFCLPAGPLREPISRLKFVDFIVVNGKEILDAATHTHTTMQFVIDDIINIIDDNKKITPSELKHKKIMVIAGIGNPDRFFESLRALDLSFETSVFPDHYFFQQKDFESLTADIILMTEKDAVKCGTFCDDRFYRVRGHADLEANFVEKLIKKTRILQNFFESK